MIGELTDRLVLYSLLEPFSQGVAVCDMTQATHINLMHLILYRSNQAIAFNGLTLTYRLGQIIGLPLGGFLAHPERHFPSIFSTPFWLYYPFLLPCLVGAGFAFLGVLLGLIFLKEVSQYPTFLKCLK